MQTIRYVTSTADDGVEEEEGEGLGDGVYGTRFDVGLCGGVVECVVGIALFLFRLMGWGGRVSAQIELIAEVKMGMDVTSERYIGEDIKKENVTHYGGPYTTWWAEPCVRG